MPVERSDRALELGVGNLPERMLGEPGSAQMIYRSYAVHPRHQANFRVSDPLSFLKLGDVGSEAHCLFRLPLSQFRR